MKKIIIISLFFLPVLLSGQVKVINPADTVKYWKYDGITGLNFNQVALSNWTAGGVGSISFTALGKFTANRLKDRFSWNNNLNLLYGMIQNEGESLRKSEDLLDLTSVAGYDITKKWAFTGYVNFRSQFTNGYAIDNDSMKVSTFLAPGYLTISPAFRYKPVDWFSLFLSPVTAKFTFVLDQELANVGAFGVEPGVYDTITESWIEEGKNSYLYLGPFLEAYLKKDIAKGLTFESKLNILYTLINRDNLEPLDMDVSWENFLNYKLKSWLSMSFFLHTVYYPGQPVLTFEAFPGAVRVTAVPNRKVQIKESFGIGLTYTFSRPKK